MQGGEAGAAPFPGGVRGLGQVQGWTGGRKHRVVTCSLTSYYVYCLIGCIARVGTYGNKIYLLTLKILPFIVLFCQDIDDSESEAEQNTCDLSA